jgi:head-tail adaptor
MEYYDKWAVFDKVTNVKAVRDYKSGNEFTKKMLSMFLRYKKEGDVLNEMLRLDALAIPIMIKEMGDDDDLGNYLEKLTTWIKFVVDNPEQFTSEQDVRQKAREM